VLTEDSFSGEEPLLPIALKCQLQVHHIQWQAIYCMKSLNPSGSWMSEFHNGCSTSPDAIETTTQQLVTNNENNHKLNLIDDVNVVLSPVDLCITRCPLKFQDAKCLEF
jgi:hypothetical protein